MNEKLKILAAQARELTFEERIELAGRWTAYKRGEDPAYDAIEAVEELRRRLTRK